MIVEDSFYVTLALMTNFLAIGTFTGSYMFRLLSGYGNSCKLAIWFARQVR